MTRILSTFHLKNTVGLAQHLIDTVLRKLRHTVLNNPVHSSSKPNLFYQFGPLFYFFLSCELCKWSAKVELFPHFHGVGRSSRKTLFSHSTNRPTLGLTLRDRRPEWRFEELTLLFGCVPYKKLKIRRNLWWWLHTWDLWVQTANTWCRVSWVFLNVTGWEQEH